ncbi:MAG: hypothetical protein ABIO94_01155 [Opitutaceae bacterium]
MSIATARLDLVAEYLERVGQQPLLTPAKERTRWQRIERAEAKAYELIFSITSMTPYVLEIAAFLVSGPEHVARMVAGKKHARLDAYLRLLPALIAEVTQRDAELTRLWRRAMRSPLAAERRKRRRAFMAAQKSLAALLPEFDFKLEVYQEYLDRLDPLLGEIKVLQAEITAARDTPQTDKPAAHVRKSKARLTEIETAQRMSGATLLTLIPQISVHIRRTQAAKAELLSNYLRLVVNGAKLLTQLGPSFVHLIQAGNTGLMQAIERYNFRGSQEFAPFASPFITRALAKCVLERTSTP